VAAITPGLEGEAGHAVDAAGCSVAPGVIDTDAQSYFARLTCPSTEAKVRQRVTTEA
jgi:N-acyl-D-aspartate/D-glutamate deacylase